MADIHIHVHVDGYGPTRQSQVSEEPLEESEEDKEFRLMAKYSDKSQTLTPEEFDFLKRRGCVRY